jgi:hypothetical protein
MIKETSMGLCIFVLLSLASCKHSVAERTADGQHQDACEGQDIMPLGSVAQGGYAFEYQSSRGKNCRVYRVRNRAGSLLTPVLWRDNHETFLQWNLPGCPPQSECKWCSVTKVSNADTESNKTLLLYGANWDQYRDEPDSYVEKQRNQFSSGLPLLATILTGVVSSGGRTVELSIRCTSSVNGWAPYRVLYEVEDLNTAGDRSAVAEIASQDEEFHVTANRLQRELWLSWDPVSDKGRFWADRALAASWSPFIRKAEVAMTTSGIELDDSLLLQVMTDQGVLVATTAPAYVPSRR